MTIEGWSKINFNWSGNGASAWFYGCRSGKDPGDQDKPKQGDPFVQNLSRQANMNGVEVAGQTQRSYPSPYTNVRLSTSDIQNNIHGYPTYFVGSGAYGIQGYFQSTVSRLMPTYAYPLAIYKNGQFLVYKYQPGLKR